MPSHHGRAASRTACTLFGDEPGRLRLADCSHWPERATCGQNCLIQDEG